MASESEYILHDPSAAREIMLEVAHGTQAVMSENCHNTSGILQSGARNTADILQTENINANHVLTDNARATQSLLMEACHDTSAVLQAGSRNAADVIAASERLGFAGQDRTDKIGVALRDSIESGVNLNLAATERNGADIRLGVQRNAGEIRAALADQFAQTQLGIKDVQLRILEGRGAIERQAAEYQGVVRFDILKSQEKLAAQAASNYASVQLEAAHNKEELARQMAECCCEIKERVGDTATATQALLQTLDANRIRDSLAAANTENLAARLRRPSH